jgi:hypothetical protein
MVLDIADAYSGAASAAAGVGLAPLFALESETRLLGLALSVPVLALLLLVSLRMELRGRSAGLKLQDAHAAWALAELPSPVQALSRGVRYLAAVVMRAGPVPRHVAFIMDGNRRWAKQLGVKTLNGHTAGYEAMCGILEHCKDLGVEVVTVYAFSIENFKRDQAEVDYIMDLAMRKFEDAVSETGDLFKHKVRVRPHATASLSPRGLCPDHVRHGQEYRPDLQHLPIVHQPAGNRGDGALGGGGRAGGRVRGGRLRRRAAFAGDVHG